MNLSIAHALRYPFQGEDWFRRLLPLVMLQFIPVVGQLILVGYGMDVARAVYEGQRNLPAIHPLRMLKDGVRFVAAGLLYIAPMLAVVPTILTVGSSGAGGGNSFVLPLLFTVVVGAVVAPMIRRLPARAQALRKGIRGLILVVSVLMIASSVINLLTSPTSALVNLQSGVQLNSIGVLLSLLLAVLVYFILLALHVGGVRHAVEGRGLFDPTGNARLLLKKRAGSVMLLLNMLLIWGLTILTTMLGVVLLILPGLFAFVVCSIALWFLIARFAMNVGLPEAKTERAAWVF